MTDEHDTEYDGVLGSAATETEEPTGPGGGRRRARKRRSVPGCLAVLVALAVIVGGFYFVVTWGIDKVGDQFSSAADYDGPGHGKVTFQVVSGDSAAAIGRRLKGMSD